MLCKLGLEKKARVKGIRMARAMGWIRNSWRGRRSPSPSLCRDGEPRVVQEDGVSGSEISHPNSFPPSNMAEDRISDKGISWFLAKPWQWPLPPPTQPHRHPICWEWKNWEHFMNSCAGRVGKSTFNLALGSEVIGDGVILRGRQQGLASGTGSQRLQLHHKGPLWTQCCHFSKGARQPLSFPWTDIPSSGV